ncbi:MAG TPA: type II CAAX endopeptidase family protein [Steroidobacteraceae bacterium]|nr:type II CAAX endopeptidase family protein [Steroidobacteraceae bacterium]
MSIAGELQGRRPGPAPLLTSTWLLIRLRLRRLLNQIDALAKRKKPGDKTRTGNTGKKSSKVIFYIAWPMMLFVFGSMAVHSVSTLHLGLDPPDTFWRTVEFSEALVVGLAFLLLLLWTSSLLLNVASGELARPDWDLEWLITLPVKSDTLIWARILERSVVQPSGIAQVYMACVIIAWFSELRWLAPIAALFAAWPLLIVGAVARTLIDTGLRLSMRPAQLRNLHAVLSVLSVVTLYLAFSLGIPGKAAFMLGVAELMPDWLAWTPMGLAVLALNERTFVDQLQYFLALFAEAAVLGWAGVMLLRFQLRNGVISGSARDSARGAAPATASRVVAPAGPGLARLSAVHRREITLLSRDRNFMVQSLVLPLLIVGAQVLLGSSSMATDMWVKPNVLASVAFGLAAYSMSMSAFQTLNNEGQALWLLYTFPCSIEDVLKDKAKLWGVLTLAYPVALFAIGAVLIPTLDWTFFGAMLTALLGIPIYSFIAVALGVFGSNPLEQQQNQKVKPAYVYLYMLLAGLYVYAVVTPNFAQRLIFITLTLLLAFALWQKARDQLPYLLDPDASPPPRVSTSDGLIAAMVFFVLQGVIALIVGKSGPVTGDAMLVGFVIAGGLTYLLMRWVYSRAKTANVPRMFGAGSKPILGIAAGLATGALALGYLYVIALTGWLDEDTKVRNSISHLGLWALPLALIAAPVFEEFIFRGLIFGGLRRSFGLWPSALASAGVFAIVHPPISVVPVFCMGVCAALVYDRSRSLLAPMLTHCVYNAGALAAQVWLL